jgi:hypothetical protein
MHNEYRRRLITLGGSGLAACALLGTGLGVRAAEHEGHQHPAKGVAAFVVDATETGVCATCRFWGGQRRVSEDKKSVHCETLGWCNNADSHHYQAMTTPDTGPMKSWKKWEAL